MKESKKESKVVSIQADGTKIWGFDEETRPNAVVETHKILFEGIDVKRAVLQGSFPIPGGGGEATSLYDKVGPGIGGSAVSAVKMKYNSEGLWCEYKGHGFVIPLPNIKGCWF